MYKFHSPTKCPVCGTAFEFNQNDVKSIKTGSTSTRTGVGFITQFGVGGILSNEQLEDIYKPRVTCPCCNNPCKVITEDEWFYIQTEKERADRNNRRLKIIAIVIAITLFISIPILSCEGYYYSFRRYECRYCGSHKVAYQCEPTNNGTWISYCYKCKTYMYPIDTWS